MMDGHRRPTLPTILGLFTLCFLALEHLAAQPPQPASPSDDAAFVRRARQFERILLRNPRQGTAFRLWYQHHLDAGRLKDLQVRVQQLVDADPDKAGPLVLQAMVLTNRGKVGPAERALRQAVTMDDVTYYPYLMLGRLGMRAKKWDSAGEMFEKALTLKPPRNDATLVLKQLGRCYLRQGDIKRATATWERLIAKYPNDNLALEELAQLLADERRWKEAIARWKEVISRTSRDPRKRAQAELELARLYNKSGKPENAVQLLGEMMERLRPGSTLAKEVARRLRDSFVQQDKLEDWLKYCSDYLQRHPQDLAMRRSLAGALEEADRADEAVKLLRESVRLAPSERDLRIALIELLVRRDNFKGASTEADELAERLPQDLTVLTLQGRLKLMAADDRESGERQAIGVWQRLTELRSDDPQLAVRAAELCRESFSSADRARLAIADRLSEGELQKVWGAPLALAAEKFYREAVRRAPSQAQYHEFLGEYLHHLGRRKQAVSAWQHLIADKNDAAQWFRLGEVFLQYAYLDEALQAINSALEIADDVYRYHDLHVDVQIRLGDHDAAMKAWDRLRDAAATDAEMERAIVKSITILNAADRLEMETDRRRQAIKKGRATYRDHWTLAMLLAELWLYDDAISHLQQARKMAPGNHRILRDLARSFHRNNKLDDAIGIYRELIQRDERQRREYYQRTIELLVQQQKFPAALQDAVALVALAPSELNGYRIKASVETQMGRGDDALQTMRRAVRVSPRDPAIRTELAKALFKLRQYAESMEHYWRAFELASSTEEKLSIVAGMSEVASADDTLDLLAQRFRDLGRARESRKLSALCLVELLQRSKNFHAARDELEQYLTVDPDDAAILSKLTTACELAGDWKAAVRYQQRVVDLAPSVANLRQLARYFSRAGQEKEATNTWVRLLSEKKNAEAMVAGITDLIQRGKIKQALAIARLGVEKAPDQWQLLLTLGTLEWGLGEYADAERHFMAILALRETMATRSAPTSPPVRTRVRVGQVELRNDWLPNFYKQRADYQGTLRAGEVVGRLATVKTGLKRLSNLRDGSAPLIQLPVLVGQLPTTLAEAQAEAIVALLVSHREQRDTKAWIPTIVADDRINDATIRQMAIGMSVLQLVDSHSDAYDSLIERLGTASLPRLLRLITRTPKDLPAAVLPSARRAVSDSYDWLAEQRPQWRKELFINYGTRLIELHDTDAAKALLQKAIEEANSTEDLLALGKLPFELGNEDVRRAYFRALDSHLPKTPADTQSRVCLATLLTLMGRPTIDFANEKERAVYLRAVGQILTSADGAEGTTIVHRAHTMTPLATSDSLLRSDCSHLISLLDSPTRIRKATTTYPSPNGFLSVVSFRMLELATYQTGEAMQAEVLTQYLTELEKKASTPDSSTALQLSLASHLWWRDLRDESLSVFAGMCKKSMRGDLHYALAEAYYTQRQFARTLMVLAGMKNNGDLGDRIASLRRLAAEKWGRALPLRILAGHRSSVKAIEFSPKGDLVATGSYDNEVRLWNTATGVLRHTLKGHSDFILALAFSSDGRSLASVGYDRSVRLWDVTTGKPLRVLDGHDGVVRAVRFSADGKTLVTAGDDRRVIVWNMATGKQQFSFERGRGVVAGIAFSADGQRLVVGSGKQIEIWDVAMGKRLRTLEGHDGSVRAIAVAAQGNLMASGGGDSVVKLWDMKTGKLVHEFKSQRNILRALAFSPDGKRLAAGGEDRTVWVFDLTSEDRVARFEQHSQSITSVVFHPDSRTIASSSYGERVYLWEVSSLEALEQASQGGR